MRRRIGLLIAAATFVAAGPALAAQVVALGASNTYGRGKGQHPDGVPMSQAYPAQLQAMLAAQGCRVTVLNAGVPGDTTGGMLRRLPRSMGKDTKVVIVQPGGNDARRGLTDSRENLAAISAYVESRGAKVVMLDNLGIARGFRLPDRQHFSSEGHKLFAQSVLSEVASAACGR